MTSIPEGLEPYAAQLGYPTSETLGQLLALLFDTEEKVKIAIAMPGSAPELAKKTGNSIETTEQMLGELHHNGAINKKMYDQSRYRLFPGMIELRDASALTPGISGEMIQLWDDLVRKEMPAIVPQLEEMGLPPMMRVIPIEEAVESKNLVLDIDSARQIVQGAELVVAIPCVCRKTAREVGRGADCPDLIRTTQEIDRATGIPHPFLFDDDWLPQIPLPPTSGEKPAQGSLEIDQLHSR